MIALTFFLTTFLPTNAAPAAQDAASTPPVVTIAEDEHKRYLLHMPTGGTKAPKKGWKLLVVMPGGSGNRDFAPFVGRIRENVFDEDWLVAQIVAPVWSKNQAESNVWPTKLNPWIL